MQRFIAIRLLLQDAAGGWSEHRAQRLGAALAFYTTLALAPLTLIAIAIAGYFFGEEAARGEIVDQIEHLVGRDEAIAIEDLIQKASEPHHSRMATVISFCLLFFGATGVFAELKDSLDTIWEVKRKPGLGLWTMIKTQLLSFTVVVGTGFLLLVSLRAIAR
jgi:membrane protein